jgi:cell division control protein 45
LEPDALCACRILTALLKRDYIPHKIQPVSGYGDLADIGERLVRPMRTTEGGSGGVVICLGLGGLVDLGAILGLESDVEDEDGHGGVEVWVFDARRPWNLGNVFGGIARDHTANGEATTRPSGIDRGRIQQHYKPGSGGIIVFDDGDIEEELTAEREAYCTLEQMPELDEVDDDVDDLDSDSEQDEVSRPDSATKKRERSDDEDVDDDSSDEDARPRQRRRGNSVGPMSWSQ